MVAWKWPRMVTVDGFIGVEYRIDDRISRG